MNRRLITNLGLLLLVAVLGFVAWLQPGLEDEQAAGPLSSIAPAAVSRLAIKRPGFDPIVLEKEASAWMMREPVQIHASEARIEALLAVLEQPVHTSFSLADVDPANFGLDSPRILLQVDGVDMAFGDTDPIARRRYVQIHDHVALIDDEHYIWLHGGANDFVSRQLLPPGAEVSRLELPGVVLQRDDGSAAWSVTPADAMSSEDAAGLVREWLQAYALAVESQGPLIEDDAKRIRLRLSDGRELAFAVTGDDYDPSFVRADLGLGWQMSAAQAARLLGQSER